MWSIGIGERTVELLIRVDEEEVGGLQLQIDRGEEALREEALAEEAEALAAAELAAGGSRFKIWRQIWRAC